MDRLIDASFSLLDYDGDLKGFSRHGKGKQEWPGFAAIKGRWSNNKLNGNAQLWFKNFPLTIYADYNDNCPEDASINFGDGELKLDVKVDKDMYIQSGIIAVNKDFEFHFKIIDGKADNFVLMQNGEALDHSEYLKHGALEYPLNPQNTLFLGFNTNTLLVELYNLDEYKTRFENCYQINLRTNCYMVLNYEQGELIDLQQVLDFGKAIPAVKRYWVRNEDEEEDSIHYADGSVLTNKAGEDISKLVYKGVDSYITGRKRDDKLRGEVDVVIDGKYAIPAEMKEEGLIFKNPQKLFKTIESVKDQTLEEYNENLLNGYAKYEYGNGTVYEGYFLNDFVYCHKDSLLSCLHNANKSRNPDLEAFLIKVSRFEGIIQNGKIEGKAKVRYKNGVLYEGYYDDYFLKTGTAIEFASNGDLYSGEFKNDMYNGFGKLFKPDKPLELGIFENNSLKLRFDMDNLDQNVIDKIKSDYVKEKSINHQKVQEVVEKNTFKPETGEEKVTKERDEKLQKIIEQEKTKKIDEAKKLIEELQKEMIVKKIFSFKNGYAYHGKIKGNDIVDNERGDIIDPEGNRIPVMYKYIKELNLGSFRSMDKKIVFIYKIETKELARIELNREAEIFEQSGKESALVASIVRSKLTENGESSHNNTAFDEESVKEKNNELISENDGISNLVVQEDTEEANLESNVYLEDEQIDKNDNNGNFNGSNNNDQTDNVQQEIKYDKNPFVKNQFFTIIEDPIEDESGIDQSAIREEYYKKMINDAKKDDNDEKVDEFKYQTFQGDE